ncbi:MAG TPA: SIS domain-containing protein [Armatimonadota bacterium]|nr:SIS domain-containing protein [Armatimonadota bacterium]
MDRVKSYLDNVAELLGQISKEDIKTIADLVMDAYRNGKQVFIMGNGGSAATASHLACDLQKGIGFSGDKWFKVMAVTDNIPIMTAWANDADYSDIFANQLAPWIQQGDLVIGISGSGNSPNIIKAIQFAKAKGAITAGMSGFKGGKLAKAARYNVVVPSDNMQYIEDVHMVLSHLIFRYLLEEIAA